MTETIYTSPRGLMQVDALPDGLLRARIDTGMPDDEPTLRRLVELENASGEYGGPGLPLTVERAGGGALVATCDLQGRRRLPTQARCSWKVAHGAVAGLCTLAEHLNADADPQYLGPPVRELVFGSDFLRVPFAPLVGFIHRVESNLRGAAMTMGHFKVTPEMNDCTPSADVFFLTQFLFELVTAREPYRHRGQDYVRYLQEIREGPKIPLAVWPTVGIAAGAPMPRSQVILRVGLHPDPKIRFPDPRGLLEAIYDL